MTPIPQTNYILAVAFGSVFQLWPILILSPLIAGRGGGLWKMLIVWIVLLAMRIFLATNTAAYPNYATLFHVLSEPTYTLLFAVVGSVLLGGLFIQSYFQKRR